MRRSEFWVLADDVLGATRARTLVSDLVLDDLDDRTGERAMDDGADPGAVWTALCEALDIPPARRYAALDQRRGARA